MSDAESALSHLRFLADTCGPRPAGSQAASQGATYLEATLAGYGLHVRRHQIQVPTYSLLSSTLEVFDGGKRSSLPHKPVWFAGATPTDGVRGKLLFVNDGSEGFFRGIESRGRVLLIARDAYVAYPDDLLYRRLLAHGPAAVLFTTDAGSRGGPPDVYYNIETVAKQPPPPSAVIHYDVADRLLQMDSPEVEYQAQYEYGSGTCSNVIAEVGGTDPAAGSVIVCAHYDSVAGSPGASDNAGGAAMVVMLAKRLASSVAAGQPPRRTVRFILWSGHETGLHGSRQFFLDEPDALSSCRFALNFDGIGTRLHINAIVACASPSVSGEIESILGSCGFDWEVTLGPSGLDVMNLVAAEIPWATLTQGLTAGAHTPMDNAGACVAEAFEAPIGVASKIMEWACSADLIEQGYPDHLDGACRAYCERYGWGFYTATGS